MKVSTYKLRTFSIYDILNSVNKDDNIAEEGFLTSILYPGSSISRLIIVERVEETDITRVKPRALRPIRAIRLPGGSLRSRRALGELVLP